MNNAARGNATGDLDTCDWLDELLRAHRPPREEFRARCEGAALAAVGLQRLRLTRRRAGLPLLGIASLLGALDIGPGALRAVLDWAGLDIEAPITPGWARAWGRLASALGMARDEAMLYLRLTFAERVAPEPLALPVLFRDDREPVAVTVAALNNGFRGLADEWIPALRDELDACERALDFGWDEADPAAG